MGAFITFEGPDGTGKTTQIARLAERLQQAGYDVVTTREPGGTAIGDRVRSILLDPVLQDWSFEAEILLYAAARAQHVHQVIQPALAKGKIVLCDRFLDASIAYQSSGNGFPLDAVMNANALAIRGIQPNRTYMLMLSPEAAQQRMLKRNLQMGTVSDRIEQKPTAFHQRVYDGFQKIADENPQRVCLVNADQTVDAIASQIFMDCQAFLAKVKIEE